MKTNKTLSNHPTLVNDCYRFINVMNTASSFFRKTQEHMGHIAGPKAAMMPEIDEQIDHTIVLLQDAVKKLQAMKSNYKVYATEL